MEEEDEEEERTATKKKYQTRLHLLFFSRFHSAIVSMDRDMYRETFRL